MIRYLSRFVCLFSVAMGALLPGCLAGEGDSCRLDSDCSPGFLCGLGGACETFGAVQAHLADVGTQPPSDTSSGGDGADAAPLVDTANTGCTKPAGVFEPGTGVCVDPALKRKVVMLQLAESGHAAANLGALGNGMIASGFEDQSISLELWVDGSLEVGCERTVAWIRTADDRLADCSVVFSQNMPFAIPELVEAIIYDAVFDPATQRVSGLLNKAEMLASMDAVIRETAGNLIAEDVDIDDDGVNDRTSVIVELTFAP